MISLERWPKVKELREKLNGKAKAEPEFCFYLLYDKVYRKDFLEAAYAQCRANAGAPGVDEKTFADIETYGVERYLAELADELKERRIADRKVLWLIRGWLKVPVHETNERGRVVMISPLLANIYFRRFLVAWETRGLTERFGSSVINYADDFVILCRRNASGTLQAARQILQRIGLTLNEEKTRVGRAWNHSFNFLGYTFGRLFTRDGRAYLGQRPSEKNVLKYRETIRELTAADQTSKSVRTVAEAFNRVTRGYWNYFCLGTTAKVRHDLDQYLWERMRLWEQVKEAQGMVLYSHALPNPYRRT